MNKSKDIHIRLSAQELRNLKKGAAKRCNGNISAYIRLVISEQTAATHPEILKELMELRKEINRIGVNINQIARSSNMGMFGENDMVTLLLNQRDINSRFSELTETIRKDGKHE